MDDFLYLSSRSEKRPYQAERVTEAKENALAVLRELLKSDSETVRLQVAAAILQLAGGIQAKTDTGTNEKATSEPAVLDVVRANRFELMSADGKVVAVLGNRC